MSASFVCPRCNARVKNVPSKRHSEEQLRRIHAESCRGT